MFDQTSTATIFTLKSSYSELTARLAGSIKLETTSIELELAAIEPEKEYVAKAIEHHPLFCLEYNL